MQPIDIHEIRHIRTTKIHINHIIENINILIKASAVDGSIEEITVPLPVEGCDILIDIFSKAGYDIGYSTTQSNDNTECDIDISW